MKPLSNHTVRNLAALGWLIYLILIVFVLNWHNHLLANLTLIGLSAAGGREMGRMVRMKEPQADTTMYPFLAALFPLLTALGIYLPESTPYHSVIVIIVIGLLFTKQVFTSNIERLDSTMTRISSSVFVILYPGLFMSYFMRIGSLPTPQYTWFVYILIITLNDGFAYYVGRAFGARTKTQGYFVVSPNKSLIGFAGGLTVMLLFTWFSYSWVAPRYAPNLFGNSSIFYILAMALVCGFTSIVGDLFESTLKRSAGVKDSGTMIPGRGGVLDTIDSLAFAAPLFYYFMYFMQ